MMSPAAPPRLSEDHDADVAAYRRISGAAVAGLILGLLSPAALVDTIVWCIPVLGIAVSMYALVQIRRNAGELSGRKAALWGLWLSLCFAAAAPADLLYYRYRICREADQFTMLWFDLLAEGRPERAYQLTTIPKDRQPLDDRLWDYYNNNPLPRASLDRFVAPAKAGDKPAVVRTLLALGKSAKVQYLGAPALANDQGVDIVFLRYAVTFEEAGAKKTFFLIVQLMRLTTEDGRAFWRINGPPSAESKPANG
jgi:hypothetical protein